MRDSSEAGTASHGPGAPSVADLTGLRERVRELIDGAIAAEAAQARRLDRVRPEHRDSAANLVHYVWLRGRDIRSLQDRLADLGLSSLGRLESRVVPTLQTIAAALEGLALARAVAGGGQAPPATGEGRADAAAASADTVETSAHSGAISADGTSAFRALEQAWPDMAAGPERLAANAAHLLGPSPEDRVSRIMVTFPSEAATDPGLVEEMLEAGMDLARINCAHDGPREWAAMIGHLDAAQGVADGERFVAGGEPAPQRCLVAMDLAGPKLRTGPIVPGPQVVKAKPERSVTGRVTQPATVVLVSDHDGKDGTGEGSAAGAGAVVGTGRRIPVRDRRWLDERGVGEPIDVTDARDSDRTLRVIDAGGDTVTCELDQTAYLMPGVVLTAADGSITEVGALPAKEQRLFIRPGETMVLTRSLDPAQPVQGGPHRIGCTLGQVFDDARPGERIHFDDGKIGGVITAVRADEIEIRVESAGVDGAGLKAEKGINLPDTHLEMPALTQDDLEALPFVVEHADIVNLSFVRTPQDVADLLERVSALGRDDLDVVLKIETVEAFENLPQILLEAMRWPDVGVMIARGDLAVEAGFERMAEVQEEILWLCESGHVPVIWATQVLDGLAKTGLPSRAEVTDAAMAERAEAVMLNKGPFVTDAIVFLSGVLGRMQEHVSKKRTLLRRLRSWDLSSDDDARGDFGPADGRPGRDRAAD